MCFPKRFRWPLVLILAGGCATSTIVGAEPIALESPAYLLNIGNPKDYLLMPGSPSALPNNSSAASPPKASIPDNRFNELIDSAARDAALDPALVHAVIYVESRYNPSARSPKGAVGLMQVLPETAARYGVADPARSPEANLRAGTRYLGDLMRIFDSRVELVLAAYNAGEKAVLHYGQRIPPYRETQQYVPAVLAKYREWQAPRRPTAVAEPGYVQYLSGTRLDPRALPGTD